MSNKKEIIEEIMRLLNRCEIETIEKVEQIARAEIKGRVCEPSGEQSRAPLHRVAKGLQERN